MIKPLFQRIVVAYNGSQSSLRAVMFGIIMTRQYKCSLKVVYVVDTATIRQLALSKFIVKEEGDTIAGNLQQDGDRNLSYVASLAKTKGVKIDVELRKGAVWSEIITAADEYKANLVLLGGTTGGSRTTSSLVHDVVTEQDAEIIGSAHCSVMVVREPFIEQLFKMC